MSENEVEGFVRFNITSTPSDMRDWSAERVAAFFDGIAKMISATSEGEQVSITVDVLPEP